jgi:hypothetical protein
LQSPSVVELEKQMPAMKCSLTQQDCISPTWLMPHQGKKTWAIVKRGSYSCSVCQTHCQLPSAEFRQPSVNSGLGIDSLPNPVAEGKGHSYTVRRSRQTRAKDSKVLISRVKSERQKGIWGQNTKEGSVQVRHGAEYTTAEVRMVKRGQAFLSGTNR